MLEYAETDFNMLEYAGICWDSLEQAKPALTRNILVYIFRPRQIDRFGCRLFYYVLGWILLEYACVGLNRLDIVWMGWNMLE